jgi:hypothetical protein
MLAIAVRLTNFWWQRQGTRAELTGSEAALHDVELEAQERTAAEAMQSKTAASQIILAQAKRDAQQSRISREALEKEIAGLCGALARADCKVSERTTRAAAFRAQIWTLRGKLTKLRSERGGPQRSVTTRRHRGDATSRAVAVGPLLRFFDAEPVSEEAERVEATA